MKAALRIGNGCNEELCRLCMHCVYEAVLAISLSVYQGLVLCQLITICSPALVLTVQVTHCLTHKVIISWICK